MPWLRFRAPGTPLAASVLVERALPAAPAEERRALVAARALRRLVRSGTGWEPGPGAPARVPPGTACALDAPGSAAAAQAAPPGPLRVLVPAFPWRRGRLEADGAWHFEAVSARDGLAELLLGHDADAPPGALAALLDALARAGAPVVGDARRGGILVAGGLRVASASDPAPADFWPAEPVFAPDARAARDGALRISAATLRVLRRGHPWVVEDERTGDPGAFRAGALVHLARAYGGPFGLGRVDGDAGVAARVWARGAARPRDAESVEARVARALARRAPLLDAPSRLEAVRLLHGEADGLPGLAVDRLGPLLRVLVTSRAALPLRERALVALRGALAAALGADPPVVEVLHLRTRPAGAPECVRLVSGEWPPPGARVRGTRVAVGEDALRVWVEPGLDAPSRPRPGTGLFLDQRDNRRRVAACTRPGGRYLNLFAHTGAFSLALLAAGAGRVESVDLSAPYLAWLEENLALSGLPAERHEALRLDARRLLDTSPAEPTYDGIVLDPPTAAAAGRRFWSVRRGLEQGVAQCLARLRPGGWLLVSRNDRRGRGGLARAVESAAGAARVALARIEAAPPAPDFPSLPGFPEGDPFEAVLAVREG